MGYNDDSIAETMKNVGKHSRHNLYFIQQEFKDLDKASESIINFILLFFKGDRLNVDENGYVHSRSRTDSKLPPLYVNTNNSLGHQKPLVPPIADKYRVQDISLEETTLEETIEVNEVSSAEEIETNAEYKHIPNDGSLKLC